MLFAEPTCWFQACHYNLRGGPMASEHGLDANYHRRDHASDRRRSGESQNQEKRAVNATGAVVGRVSFLGLSASHPVGGRMRGPDESAVRPLGPSRTSAEQPNRECHATSDTRLTLRLRSEETYLRRLTAVRIR